MFQAAGLTPNLLQSETTLLSALVQTLAPGEDALQLTTMASAMSVQRRQASDMGNQTTVAGSVAITFGNRLANSDGDVLDVSVSRGQDPPPPRFEGPPNFIKREQILCACAQIQRILVVNSNPDPPPPFRNPESPLS